MILIMKRYQDCQRIKDLGMVVPFTNSERMNFACPRLWTLSNVECFDEDHHSDAITYGTIWHSFLEMILLEMRDNDSTLSEERLLQIVDTQLKSFIENELIEIGGDGYLQEYIMFDKLDDVFVRIRNGVIGWMVSWVSVMDDYRILEIELPIAAPVIDQFGDIARFDFFVVNEGEFLRPACSSEAVTAQKMRLPFWKVGKADVLLECRRTGDLWVCDHKTTSVPSSFDSAIPYDIQLPSYAYLLQYEIEKGALTKYKGKKIGGIFYDIVKSNISSQPKLLKKGGLSKAKNSGVCSWVYKQAVLKHKLPMSEYRNHITFLKNNVDARHFLHRFLHLTPSDLDRCSAEDYAIASQIAKKRSELVNINKYSYKADFNVIAYRFPLCQRYGNCRFSSICIANTHPAVITINSNPQIKWVASENKNEFPF